MSILGTDLPYPAMQLICEYFASDAKDATAVFGRVCRRWHDIVVNFSRPMWKRFIEAYRDKFLLAGLRYDDEEENASSSRSAVLRLDGRDTFHAFRMIAEAVAFYLPECSPRASYRNEIGDVEGCVSSGPAEFSFACPVLSSNLTRTTELTADGLPILFCGICKQKVHTVTTGKALLGAARAGLCVQIPEVAANVLRESSQLEQPQTHVAFVVPKSPSSSPSSSVAQQRSYDIARRVAARVTSVDYQARNPFITKDQVSFSTYTDPPNWRVHLVEVDCEAASSSSSSSVGVFDDQHGALGRAKMPRNGGWSFIVVFPPVLLPPPPAAEDEESPQQQKKEEGGGSPFRALMETGRVVYLRDTVLFQLRHRRRPRRSHADANAEVDDDDDDDDDFDVDNDPENTDDDTNANNSCSSSTDADVKLRSIDTISRCIWHMVDKALKKDPERPRGRAGGGMVKGKMAPPRRFVVREGPTAKRMLPDAVIMSQKLVAARRRQQPKLDLQAAAQEHEQDRDMTTIRRRLHEDMQDIKETKPLRAAAAENKSEDRGNSKKNDDGSCMIM